MGHRERARGHAGFPLRFHVELAVLLDLRGFSIEIFLTRRKGRQGDCALSADSADLGDFAPEGDSAFLDDSAHLRVFLPIRLILPVWEFLLTRVILPSWVLPPI
jgi:hypothetical protein